jgi:predicted branched-subunit amino acid permease
VELYAAGAPLLVIGAAVALSSARLLPMTVTLMPYLRAPGTPRWRYYLAANWIAVTAWAMAMRDCPNLPPEQRLPYFAGFGCFLWAITLVTTGIGFFLADAVPYYVTLGLVFINPIYFMLVFAGDVRSHARILALVLGAVLGPALYLLTPDWSLLLTGLIAGSAAYLAGRRRGSLG